MKLEQGSRVRRCHLCGFGHLLFFQYNSDSMVMFSPYDCRDGKKEDAVTAEGILLVIQSRSLSYAELQGLD